MSGAAAIEASTISEPLLLGEEQVHIIAPVEDEENVVTATEGGEPKVTTVLLDENNNEIV